MLRDLRYLFAYTLPLSALLALLWQGSWSFATVVYAFGVIPVLDMVIPQARSNEDGEHTGDRVLVRQFFDFLLYLNVPIFYGLLGLLFVFASSQSLATYELVGLVFSIGIIAGSLGINVAHELGHRTSRGEQVLAQALLLPCLYLHFFIEHNRGHHKHVATPHDPATSRFGESLYVFWVRSVFGSYLSAWRIDRAMMVRFTLLQGFYLVLVSWFFGAQGLALALGVAVVGILLLESVNYIEHYGLLRKRLPNGRYEPVTPRHSWNSEHEVGRIVLYELTRHADHHYKSTRPYQELRYLEESPELPMGYPGSILMALVPPLWFGVMNPRTQQHQLA